MSETIEYIVKALNAIDKAQIVSREEELKNIVESSLDSAYESLDSAYEILEREENIRVEEDKANDHWRDIN